MNGTIELGTSPLSTAEEFSLRQKSKLVAHWQSGPQTLAGYEQSKLRLTFARLPVDARQTALDANQS